MPNHVVTVIDAPKEVLDALCRRQTDEEFAEAMAEHERIVAFWAERNDPYTRPAPSQIESFVDFGLLIPEPESMFHGGCDHQHPHPNPDGGFYEHCWYEWNRANWGTKWNAYSHERRGDTQLKFETAWSHPYPILEALQALP